MGRGARFDNARADVPRRHLDVPRDRVELLALVIEVIADELPDCAVWACV